MKQHLQYECWLALAALVVIAVLAACIPPPTPLPSATETPLPEEPPTPLPEAGCCADIGGISLDFSTLPFAPGSLPAVFTFGNVDFTRIWNEIKFGQGSLWCWGSGQWLGVWNDATVKLDFYMLPCQVCKIVAEVDGHGPEARLEGRLRDGTTQTAVCPGDRRTMTMATSADNPFISTTLAGQEAQWFVIRLE